MDQVTNFANSGKFARMCIEMDFTKPFTGIFMLNNKFHKIVYGGVHLICFNCGMQGHNIEACNKGKEAGHSAPVADMGGVSTASNGQSQIVPTDGKCMNFTSMERGTQGKELNANTEKETFQNFGLWMVVDRKSHTFDKNKERGGFEGNKHVIGRSRIL